MRLGVYPRIGQSPPGKPVQFFNYDPDDKGWYVYGVGTVTATAVVPDVTRRFYGFTGLVGSAAGASCTPRGPGARPVTGGGTAVYQTDCTWA